MPKSSLKFVVVLIACVVVLGACTGARLPTQVAARNHAPTTLQGSDTTVAGGATSTTDVFGSTGQTVPKVTTPGGGKTTPGGQPIAPARSTLFNAKEDTTGITPTSITLCAHAALTYGAAFHTSESDLNVHWTAVNAKGGIFGRKVNVTYENDNYSPDTAVQAATACEAKGIFFLLGGIGFDQIPAVRNWAEANHMLYLHHTATVNGTANQHYSFTGLPSTEKMGEMFGELAAARFRGKKVGIIERNSPNWEPGVTAFMKIAKKYGIDVVADRKVENNQANYTQDLLELKRAGADLVWIWENALASTQIVKQANAQNYSPKWMLFPFNLTSQTLGAGALNPPMVGVAMYPAYSQYDYSGGFASYADDMKQFEAEYSQYDSGADLGGLGGDLLFLNWTGQKGLEVLLKQCGPNCTRNRMVDVMTSLKMSKPFSSACDIDFTRPGFARMGGFSVNIMETYRAPSDKVNWRNTDTCVEHLL